ATKARLSTNSFATSSASLRLACRADSVACQPCCNGSGSSHALPSRLSNSSLIPATAVDSQNPVALVRGCGGIKSRAMSAPNRLTTRAVAEVPDLCMPATIMPIFEGDLRPVPSSSCMHHPHVLLPRSQTRGRLLRPASGHACRVFAATNRWCPLYPRQDRRLDENQSCRAESKWRRQGAADHRSDWGELRSLRIHSRRFDE